MKYLYAFCFLFSIHTSFGQTGAIEGTVRRGSETIPGAGVLISPLNTGVNTDNEGNYRIDNIPDGEYEIIVSYLGFKTVRKKITIDSGDLMRVDIELEEDGNSLEEVVVTGTMKVVSRSESPIPVEIITPKLFKKNPTPSLFEAVGMVNGVQPQLNCNVCNTGDIHINGMEGPYTMILIDGMPIVSSLSTVYGLSGIPNSIVERIEVVKGPASSLYGSEAMGGIINVITKAPYKAPIISADYFVTSWGEHSLDGAFKFKTGKATSLLGLNYFNYSQKVDKNNDNFTDVTLQDRVSVFNKWDFERSDNRTFTLAGRYVYEDRWGGELQWSKKWRGSDSIYGESIYTRRAELIGLYQLPVAEKIYTQFSYN